MRNLIIGALLAVQAAAASAGGSATITCGNAAPGVYNNGQAPLLHIHYSTPLVDQKMPALFWLGVLSPNQKNGAVLTDKGWMNYEGGLYPFLYKWGAGLYGTTDQGLPPSISLTIPIPGGAMTTGGFVGFTVYAGHGVYTKAAQEMVANRRAMLNEMKPARVAAGTWRTEYESDDLMIWSLAQKDGIDNQKGGAMITVPFIDCTLPQN